MFVFQRFRNVRYKLMAFLVMVVMTNIYIVSRCCQSIFHNKDSIATDDGIVENECTSIYDPRNKCPNSAPVPVNRTLLRTHKCKNCTKTVFEFLGNPDKKCTARGNEDILIIVFTCKKKGSYEDRRRMVRNTWGSKEQQSLHGFRLLFLLGRYESMTEDTIQPDEMVVDMDEEYRNLTYKTISLFQFSYKYCSHFKYVVKTDDDVIFNIPKLRATIEGSDMKK